MPSPKRIAATLATLLASATAAFGAAPDADLHCSFRHTVSEVDTIAQVPRPIQTLMLAHMDPAAREDATLLWHLVMAPRGAAFDTTGAAAQGTPSRRFLRAGQVGNEWFVWYERGGTVPTKNIALFHLRLGRAVPIVRALVPYTDADPCQITDDLLDGKNNNGDRPTAFW